MSILSSAADVLRCFSTSRRDLTVTDLVLLLGMPKSNASRLLRAMRDEGILETVGDSKRYRPSLLLNRIGSLYRLAAPLIERSDAAVRRISDEFGHAGYVSVRRGADIVGVTVHPGRHALRVVTSIGDHIPAFASSTGRALLARLPDNQIRALYPAGFTAPSETAPRDAADLLARIAIVRRTGFAESSRRSGARRARHFRRGWRSCDRGRGRALHFLPDRNRCGG